MKKAENKQKKVLIMTFSNNSDHQDMVVGLYEEISSQTEAYCIVSKEVQVPIKTSKNVWLVNCPKRPGICRGTFNFFEWLSIILRIKNAKFDVIFFETLHIWNLPILLLSGSKTKTFQMIHDVIPHEGDKEEKSVNLMNRIVCKLADNIIICNKRYKGYLCEKYNITSTRVKSVSLWKRFDEYKYTPRTGHMLFFGRLNPYKGVDNLNEIIDLCPNVIFDIVGKVDSQIQDIVDEIAQKRNVIINNNFVQEHEIASFFRAADWIILPYNSATQSGIVLESYRFSKPVIAFDVGAIAEQVENGISGYLISQGNIESFANKINEVSRIAEVEYEKICESTYRFGVKNFDISEVAKKIMDIFEERN